MEGNEQLTPDQILANGHITLDMIFDLYTRILMDGFVSDGPLFTSMNQLQEWRPDLTDEVLAESGFIRGVHIAHIHDGLIEPYAVLD